MTLIEIFNSCIKKMLVLKTKTMRVGGGYFVSFCFLGFKKTINPQKRTGYLRI